VHPEFNINMTLLLPVGDMEQPGTTSVRVIDVRTTVCPGAVTNTVKVPTPEALAVTDNGVCAIPDLVYPILDTLLGTSPLIVIVALLLGQVSVVVIDVNVTEQGSVMAAALANALHVVPKKKRVAKTDK